MLVRLRAKVDKKFGVGTLMALILLYLWMVMASRKRATYKHDQGGRSQPKIDYRQTFHEDIPCHIEQMIETMSTTESIMLRMEAAPTS